MLGYLNTSRVGKERSHLTNTHIHKPPLKLGANCVSLQTPFACPVTSVLSRSKRTDKRIHVLSVEDEWVDLDKMQSSM